MAVENLKDTIITLKEGRKEKNVSFIQKKLAKNTGFILMKNKTKMDAWN